MKKIQIFESIVHMLKDWYMDVNKISSLDDFNVKNDFSVLKLMKLHFLVTAINSNENDDLISEFSFFAMPYGPVETDIYDKIKKNSNFSNFSVNNFRANFSENIPSEIIDIPLQDSIALAITTIKKIEPTLICADAGSLVELTHKWNCWQKTFKEAQLEGVLSKKIPNDLIKKDNKFLNIEMVW